MLTIILVASYILIGLYLFQWFCEEASEHNPGTLGAIAIFWPIVFVITVIALIHDAVFEDDNDSQQGNQ